MATTTNTLIANITATEDSSNSVDINRAIGTQYDAFASAFVTYYALFAGANPIAFPAFPRSVVTQVYIKNLDAAKTIQVTWTQNGGASVNVVVLNPGDLILLWANPAGATTPGISGLSLQPSAVGCLVEWFLGG